MNPENPYHKNTIAGAYQPILAVNFLVNKIISNMGLVKFEYIKDKLDDHFSISDVIL